MKITVMTTRTRTAQCMIVITLHISQVLEYHQRISLKMTDPVEVGYPAAILTQTMAVDATK